MNIGRLWDDDVRMGYRASYRAARADGDFITQFQICGEVASKAIAPAF
tara:strand:+ start:440 stop:583 length:144 start_codon:yes stop_codon:yes gene_type:complete